MLKQIVFRMCIKLCFQCLSQFLFWLFLPFTFWRRKLIHLRDHPMLLTSQERLHFLVLALMSLNYEKNMSDWKARFDGLYKEQKVDIAKRVENDLEYKKVFNYKILSNSASSQIIFSRNVIIHINGDRQCVCTLICLSSLYYY